ncbi:MAG TPA: hypothetical protein VJA26_00925 [Gammaproteobacteria bacterium]|nr:hypothetical protein [Gammaproteobacteria bacterium]
MTTRKLIPPNTGLAGALVIGLLSQQAGATEEMVVYGAATAAISVEQGLLRSEVERYIRSFKLQLDQEIKRQSAPKVELASSGIATRG